MTSGPYEELGEVPTDAMRWDPPTLTMLTIAESENTLPNLSQSGRHPRLQEAELRGFIKDKLDVLQERLINPSREPMLLRVLSRALFKIGDRPGIVAKINCITSDNAPNNDS
ncbi:hypothetical protein D9613_003677 [Agrocybe pediades]|uniref:Uncharacterized protein n=1 Tax=Agrocybe pediades TaxID=84607 RepID=A0A8H4VIH4_9AGAR|nr:hypothetical protein D9613_003677 [Agrocybe pediades]